MLSRGGQPRRDLDALFPRVCADAALARFRQIQPSVLLAVDGYRFGGREVDCSVSVAHLHDRLPSLRAVVEISYAARKRRAGEGLLSWNEFLSDVAPLGHAYVYFDHPLWIVYTLGPIVHGHGGILLEHMKALSLHHDLRPKERFFWFTSTGWMMWNYLVSGLLVGATVVLFDGHPMRPDPRILWSCFICRGQRLRYWASYLVAAARHGYGPGDYEFGSLREIGSNGAP